MNADKLTKKTAEVLSSAQEIATRFGNPEILEEHVLKAMADDGECFIFQLLSNCGYDVNALNEGVNRLIGGLSKQQGGMITLSQSLNSCILEAKNIADNMKDEYLSVVHNPVVLSQFPLHPSGQAEQVLAPANEYFPSAQVAQADVVPAAA